MGIKSLISFFIMLTILCPVSRMLPGFNAYANQNDLLKGPSFGDPSKTQSMPEEWIKKPIKHQSRTDLVITLNQQFYDFLKPIILRYGDIHGLKIIVGKGTCGISAKMLQNKDGDITGFCCPPAKTDRLPGVRFHTIAIHPLSLLVNADNTIDNLTLSQARQIFGGKIVRWSELGWKDIPIQPVMRLHCKKRLGHWRLLLDNEDLFSPALQEVGSIPDMYDVITSSQGAIGFEVNWVEERYEGKLKTMKIDGHPSLIIENLLSGKYPFYRTMNLTTWEDGALAHPHALKIVEYLKKEMQTVENNIGIIPQFRLRQAGWKFAGDELIGEPNK